MNGQKDSPYYLNTDLSKETAKINELIALFRKNGDQVIFIRHIEDDEDAFEDVKSGSELIAELDVQEEDIVIKKYSISPFHNTDLSIILEVIEEIVVVGALINACVRSLVSDAYDRKFAITIITDCCVAMDKETHEFTIKDIQVIRPEIKVMSSDEYLNNQS